MRVPAPCGQRGRRRRYRRPPATGPGHRSRTRSRRTADAHHRPGCRRAARFSTRARSRNDANHRMVARPRCRTHGDRRSCKPVGPARRSRTCPPGPPMMFRTSHGRARRKPSRRPRPPGSGVDPLPIPYTRHEAITAFVNVGWGVRASGHGPALSLLHPVTRLDHPTPDGTSAAAQASPASRPLCRAAGRGPATA